MIMDMEKIGWVMMGVTAIEAFMYWMIHQVKKRDYKSWTRISVAYGKLLFASVVIMTLFLVVNMGILAVSLFLGNFVDALMYFLYMSWYGSMICLLYILARLNIIGDEDY